MIAHPMAIDVKWLPPFHGPDEVKGTSAVIQIRFGSENATRLEDLWSQSVQDGARVSAYSLALWFAASWWRIRWEPLPSKVRLAKDADTNWRLSHELPAAGNGFIWPQLVFSSDGEAIRVICRPSPILSSEPIRYLSEFEVSIPAKEFERSVDSFIDLVLSRLDPQETDLHVLWREVLAERFDAEQSADRRLEARLGYDADEAPPQVLQQLRDLAQEAGEEAAEEVAPVCAGNNPLDRKSVV